MKEHVVLCPFNKNIHNKTRHHPTTRQMDTTMLLKDLIFACLLRTFWVWDQLTCGSIYGSRGTVTTTGNLTCWLSNSQLHTSYCQQSTAGDAFYYSVAEIGGKDWDVGSLFSLAPFWCWIQETSDEIVAMIDRRGVYWRKHRVSLLMNLPPKIVITLLWRTRRAFREWAVVVWTCLFHLISHPLAKKGHIGIATATMITVWCLGNHISRPVASTSTILHTRSSQQCPCLTFQWVLYQWASNRSLAMVGESAKIATPDQRVSIQQRWLLACRSK